MVFLSPSSIFDWVTAICIPLPKQIDHRGLR
jgi:hypothetical protein